jgi:transcriptional regulator with XRE-family HTH domain
MHIGDKIKKVREAKGLSQKQVALSLSMDQAQYSRIENNKTDPLFSNVVKIANSNALGSV